MYMYMAVLVGVATRFVMAHAYAKCDEDASHFATCLEEQLHTWSLPLRVGEPPLLDLTLAT